jgi:undecaprenol kinase
MRRMKRSLGFALAGLAHAFERERNLRMFLWGYIVVIGLGFYLQLLTWEWLALIITGFAFFAVELLNTAIERLTDVIDQNRKIEGGPVYHAGLKAAKDVGAGASLAALVMNVLVICIVFWPYVAIMVKAKLQQ